jgi:hypothetical protein
MIIEENEYTPSGLVAYCNTNFKKTNNKPFTMNDIQQYVKLGRIPYKYGKLKITKKRDNIQKITILLLIKN